MQHPNLEQQLETSTGNRDRLPHTGSAPAVELVRGQSLAKVCTHLHVGDEQQLGELGAAVDQAVPGQQVHGAVSRKPGPCW